MGQSYPSGDQRARRALLQLSIPVGLLLLSFQNCGQGGFTQKDLNSLQSASVDASKDLQDNDKELYSTSEKFLRELEPAMAVRAPACIACHAKIGSNLITDFGYGNNYYFGNNNPDANIKWNSGNVYGNHGENFATLELKSRSQVVVPDVALPAAVQAATGKLKIKDYIESQLNPALGSNAGGNKVISKSSITIAAPTASEILDGFGALGTFRSIIYRSLDGKQSYSLPGLEVAPSGQYVRNNGEILCDGDVLINNVLFLENAVIRTELGCRLYVTKSVFSYGSITYSGNSALRNLQITSSRAISLGLGVTKLNGNICVPSSWYAANNSDSSITTRFSGIWTRASNSSRGAASPAAFGNAVIQDASVLGGLKDAECRPEGRSIGFDRLLLNAPEVHSRYQGHFKGTIIAEYALISLGAFDFDYDPVFSSVQVLPMLEKVEILKVVE